MRDINSYFLMKLGYSDIPSFGTSLGTVFEIEYASLRTDQYHVIY